MNERRGQSIIEYTIVIGIVTLVLFYMGTGVKRGVQSMVKVTADQIGNQQNADQDFNDSQQGFMESSDSSTEESKNKQLTQLGNTTNYFTNTNFNESSYTTTNTVTNGGFVQN